MSTIIRTCEYCHKSIDHRGPKAKTCSNTCKQYAMEVRQGKREPTIKTEIKTEPVEETIDKEELDNQLAKLEKELIDSDNKLRELKEKYEPSYEPVQNSIWENFRLREKRNDFLQKHFFKNGEVSGSDLLKYGDLTTKYPFEDLDHMLFSEMGRPPQPFLAAITGEKKTGKTILGVLISIQLAKYLKAKVLHILDFENRAKAIEYYGLQKINSDNLLTKEVEQYQEIENSLARNKVEFLVLDSIENLKINYKDLIRLRKAFPKLSIFFITEGRNKSIIDSSLIQFKTELYSTHGTNGAAAKIFVNNTSREEQGVCIFLNNDFNGFSIGF